MEDITDEDAPVPGASPVAKGTRWSRKQQRATSAASDDPRDATPSGESQDGAPREEAHSTEPLTSRDKGKGRATGVRLIIIISDC